MPIPFPWRYTIREVRRRPLRSALTLVGIVLGVAAVAAIGFAAEATRGGYAGMYRLLGGQAQVEVVPATGQGAMPPALDVLEKIPGVEAAAPVVLAPTSLLTTGGPEPILALGVDPEREVGVRDYKVVEGEGLGGDGLLLESRFARRHGCAVGKPVRLQTGRGPVEVPVTGLLAPIGPARFNGGAVAILPLKRAQSLFAAPGVVSAVQLVLNPSADVARVRAAVEAALPGRTVRPLEERGRLAADFLWPTEQALRSLSAIAFVAGALVILNTFLMSLRERQRQLALLRALGTTSRQVTGLLLRQALLLGGLGTLLGLPLGVLLAAGLLRINEFYLDVALPALPLHARPLLLAGLLGPAMTLLATLPPAWRTARQPPLLGLSPRAAPQADRTPIRPTALGVALVGGVLLFETAIVRGWIAPAAAMPLLPVAVAAGLVGCACLLPALLPLLLRVASWVIPPALGVEGRLAVRHLRRQRARTGLTVGVIFAAVTACVSFGMSFLTNLRDIQVWFQATINSPFLVRAVRPDPAVVVTPAPLPAGTAEEVARLPGAAAVSPFRFQPTAVNGEPAMLIPREFPADVTLPMLLQEGDPAAVRAGLARGEVVLGGPLAHHLGAGVGDVVTLPGRDGPALARVAGVCKEYTTGGMAAYLEWSQANRLLGAAEPHGLAVHARPGEEETLRAALGEYAAARGLLLQSDRDFAESIDRVVAGVRSVLFGLVALVGLVAVVGVVNTLTTNVLDQTRELGVLRALGMRRGQLRKLVLAQALTLALVSCLAGVPVGVLLALLMNWAAPGLLGHEIPFRVEWWFVSAAVVGVALVAALAAAAPARRAERLAVLDALRYE